MNTKHVIRGSVLAGLAAALLATGGCASPAARIKRNSDLFNSFPPEVQEKVSQGQVGTGYTQDMVYIALGRPTRVYARTAAVGDAGETRITEVWSYTRERWTVDSLPYASSRLHRAHDGHVYRDSGLMWVDVEERVEYEYMRIEFFKQRVVAIEMLQD